MRKKMRAGFARQLLALMIAAGAASAPAQEIPGRGDMAFGGGQMVRGTVTAAAADHLTIKTDTGETYEVALSPNTRIMKDQRTPADTGKERQQGDAQSAR